MSAQEQLQKILSENTTLIAYQPMRDEIKWSSIPLFAPLAKKAQLAPQDKHTDPFAYANSLTTEGTTCVLVPGTAFDIRGTRHGHGGGWYDRFLSRVPATWVRIGITDISTFSETLLKKELWDEPMDWIIVRDGSLWNIHETKARK